MSLPLEQTILNEAHRLGFFLAGVTTPDPPPHFPAFERWLADGHNAGMDWLSSDHSRLHRADPRRLLPGCKSILVLGVPYNAPLIPSGRSPHFQRKWGEMEGGIASYALGEDYHLVLPPRLQNLVDFIEAQVGRPVPNRQFTDSGPLLERDFAQRAGLGWIGKNTCLIHPRAGSYFLLAEILLDLPLEPSPPFSADHCGTCTRCIEACPTRALLPGRVLDARRCLSYLTIENKDAIPEELRPLLGDLLFGCDLCQQACPWNRFAAPEGDASFRGRAGPPFPGLTQLLGLTPSAFRQRFERSPLLRAKRRGLLRNAAVVLGNRGDADSLPALETALDDPEPLVREHAQWAIAQIVNRQSKIENLKS